MIANLETGIINKLQIVPALVAPWDDMFKKEGSKLKLQFRSRATVRNITTDSESKPCLLEVFSMTSCRFQQNTCNCILNLINKELIRRIAQLGTVVLEIQSLASVSSAVLF